MYSIQWKKRARKDLARLDAKLRERVQIAVAALADNPRPPGCKKLKGGRDVWRIRLGDWRVLYRIRDERLLVIVLRVIPRGGAYD